MKNWKYILLGVILFPLVGMVSSCSKETTDEEEFENWQAQNDAYINKLASDSKYTKILTYTKDASTTGNANTDYVYVEVLESGSGTETPLFTDTVRLAYRGNLIPSKSYSDGYVFDQTYSGDFDWDKAGTTDFSPCETGLRDGFATVLQHMHIGDRWRVHFSYELGYGTSDYNSIPAYSNLIFEIAVYDFWHPGETRPAFKSRQM